MSSPKVIVWGGIASIFGGLLWVSIVLTPADGNIMVPLGLLLALGGLAALHARQGKQADALGWAGFVLGILGTSLVLASFMWQWISGNFINPNSSLGMLFGLGMPILGIGSILIGVRTVQTKILPRSTGMLSVVVGVSQIGLSISVWLMDYYLAPKGIDPWNPMTIPARATLLLLLFIGILWIALGATLATNPSWQDSTPPFQHKHGSL